MVDIPLTVLVAVITVAVTTIGLLLGFFYYIHGKFDNIDEKFDEKFENINKEISSSNEKLFVECKEIRGNISDESKEIRKDIYILSQRLSVVESGIEHFKSFIPVYKMMTKPNPHPDKFILLDKLYYDTITQEEAITLQNILEKERLDAETSGDALKVLVIVGILAFLALIIARLSKRP